MTNFQARAHAAGHVELSFYDGIGATPKGGGITSQMVSEALSQHKGGNVTAYINSPGGSAFEGIGIYNILRNHPGRITTVVQGIAASAASVIAMAGDEIQMNESAMLMMHDASGVTMGNSEDHKKTMETLDKLDGSIASIYASKTGGDPDTIREMMDEETWMNAEDALTDGYVDSVIVANIPTNTVDLSIFNNVPQDIAERFGKRANPEPQTKEPDMTPEQFKAEHKDIVDGWLNDEAAEAYSNAKDDAKAMIEACGGDKEAAMTAWLEGKTIEDARNERSQTIEQRLAAIEEENALLKAKNEELQNGADALNLNPSASVDNDTPSEEDEKKVAVFNRAKKMRNDMGRASYLNDLGIDFDEYTKWLENHA